MPELVTMSEHGNSQSFSGMKLAIVGLLTVAWIVSFSSATLFAQDSELDADETVVSDPATVEQDTDDASEADEEPATLDTGDNAWMLVCSALVLMMTAPGLALFYGGLVRRKNVLSVLMQCIYLMGLMTVLWGVIGYSLSFAPGNAIIGGFDHVFMRGVQCEYVDGEAIAPIHPDLSIPMLTHMLFQGMFFIITPALICGAFAERMKFSTMAVFSVIWGLVVYCPLCHMVWGGGLLQYQAGQPTLALGALDFAGGTVVHISSGASALVCALVLGKRIGFGKEPMPPHNLAFTALGAAMLWVGWFGFNGGSALAADGIASSAFCATHFAAAAGALAWASAEWIQRGKPTVLGTCSGAVAGLVCITPAAGFVLPMSAILMGFAGGLACFFACTTLKNKFGYDDSLDAFGVHGVGGTLGAILTGVFATRAVSDIGNGDPLGLLEGGYVIIPQILATVISWGGAALATFVILKILDATMGLRVSPQEEIAGLDFSLHNEEGYIFN
jgi:ammonium transporter, Amt family